MGRHKCDVIACLSSQTQSEHNELLYCVLNSWQINLILFDSCNAKNGEYMTSL